MTWTGSNELKAQLTRQWERGELLRDLVDEHSRFPLRLSLKTPTSGDITHRFDEVRRWVMALESIAGIRIERQEIRHRVQGMQSIPTAVWIDRVEDALTWLRKHKDREQFSAQVATTRQIIPALLPWLRKRPLDALALTDQWATLLSIVQWLQQHPHPGIYLRQVDLPGVHSKFIEAHRGVLTELLDLALPSESVNSRHTGIRHFAARYGFMEKPTRIRFRMLDATLSVIPGMSGADITLDADHFAQLTTDATRIFITENETNFLVFPAVQHAMVIFGGGYGWDALARSHWLTHLPIYYWGDIDTHGFGILDQLRAHFGHVTSFLMDKETLHAHSTVWGHEDQPLRAELTHLTQAEQALYDDLRDNRIRNNLRLEQEHISFGWMMQRLATIAE